MESAHKLGVGHTLETGSGVDTLYPEGAEVALLGFAVAVCVLQTFLPSVLGYGPDVAACSEVAAGELQDSFALCARCYVIY